MPPAPIDEERHTSVGIAVGRLWRPRDITREDRAPDQWSLSTNATYVGAWLLRDVDSWLAVGVSADTTVNPYGCDGDELCRTFRQVRLSGVADLRFVLSENAQQGLELFGRLDLGFVSASGSGDQRRAPTQQGVGSTARLGPRLRMRSLTLAPHVELVVAERGGYGFGLQLGVRL